MTPLGVPVLPLEKMTAARSSGCTWPTRRRAGSNRAAAIVSALDAGVNAANKSSRNMVPGNSGSLAFSRKVREEKMVEIPHFSIACAMASSPAVKFRLTAVLPASVTPRFASAPPTDDGSSSPMERDPPQFVWIHFLSNNTAERVSPKVSCLPVESASAVDDQYFFAASTNRRDSVLPALLLHSAA